MKSGKRRMMEGMELPNQEKIRMLREKETYTYLRILEVKKNTSGEQESYLKPN